MRSFRSILALVSVLASLRLATAAEKPAGTITARVEGAAPLTAVAAINRDTDARFPGSVDRQTGQVTISGLPLDTTYDLILTAGDVQLEGVNLHVPHSDYEEEQPLTREDIETIKKTALALNKFENEIEVLTVVGNIQHAAVILNKKRTTGFINSTAGEMVWRLELWHFDRPEETWIKSPDELSLVLHRERLQKTAFARKALALDPALGGIHLTKDNPRVDLGKVAMPSKEPGIRLGGLTGKGAEAPLNDGATKTKR